MHPMSQAPYPVRSPLLLHDSISFCSPYSSLGFLLSSLTNHIPTPLPFLCQALLSSALYFNTCFCRLHHPSCLLCTHNPSLNHGGLHLSFQGFIFAPPPHFVWRYHYSREKHNSGSASFFSTMEKRLLANLPADSTGTTLLLRLLHVWKAGNPTTPHKFFAFSTLWVDEMGQRIEGSTPRHQAEIVAAKISPGKVYNITNFGVGSPRKTHRATESTHMLILTVTTEFEEATEEADFVLQAFGFVEFEDLSDRGPTSGFLADIICRPVRIRKPGHIATINGFALMQKIFAVNERNVELTITLWGEFCSLLNLEDIKNRDKETAVILAFGGLFISEFAGAYTAGSTSATRLEINPPLGRAMTMSAEFGQSRGSIEIEIADFPTSASLSDHIRDSHKTVLELNGLAGDPPLHNPRFRCRAYIRRVNIDRPWAYRACLACHKAVTPMGNDFSCYKHDLIPAEKTRHFYKIQLEVYDDSGESTFVLLGSSADSVMPVSASDLCRSFPLDSCFANNQCSFDLLDREQIKLN